MGSVAQARRSAKADRYAQSRKADRYGHQEPLYQA
jgi:hypothetical protein